MNATAQATNPFSQVTTTYGCVKIQAVRVVRTTISSNQQAATAAETRRRIADANKWLNANWEKAKAHATESTRRLIGRDSV